MKTFQLSFIDKLNEAGFTLGNLSELPSSLQLRLKEEYPIELTDKVLSRVFNNRYQIIIPQDENELTLNPVQFFIYDVNKDQFIKDTLIKSQDKVDVGDLAILDSYSDNRVIDTLNKVKVYSKVNPGTELDGIASKYDEVIKKYSDNADEIPLDELKNLSQIYSEIPDVSILDEVKESVSEPEASVVSEESPEGTVITVPESEASSVNGPEVSSAEPVVEPTATEPTEPTVTQTEPTATEPEAQPELGTESGEPEVTPTEPKDEPKEEVDLDKLWDRMDSFENKLDEILNKLGLNEVSAVPSYSQRLKAMSQVDMGGHLL